MDNSVPCVTWCCVTGFDFSLDGSEVKNENKIQNIGVGVNAGFLIYMF